MVNFGFFDFFCWFKHRSNLIWTFQLSSSSESNIYVSVYLHTYIPIITHFWDMFISASIIGIKLLFIWEFLDIVSSWHTNFGWLLKFWLLFESYTKHQQFFKNVWGENHEIVRFVITRFRVGVTPKGLPTPLSTPT